LHIHASGGAGKRPLGGLLSRGLGRDPLEGVQIAAKNPKLAAAKPTRGQLVLVDPPAHGRLGHLQLRGDLRHGQQFIGALTHQMTAAKLDANIIETNDNIAKRTCLGGTNSI
jgi:hypothetical protein